MRLKTFDNSDEDCAARARTKWNEAPQTKFCLGSTGLNFLYYSLKIDKPAAGFSTVRRYHQLLMEI